MGIYTAAIQQLYVAYFNRPADVAGLTYWENVVTNAKGSTAAVSAAFAGSAEYKAAYAGMDAAHVVAQVYQNLFGHGPDTAGLNFWTQALLTNTLTVDNVVTGIASGAQGTDLTAYNDKVSAATQFTLALDTADKQLAYSGDKANAVAKAYIAGVTSDATLAAATSATALAATIGNVVAVGGTPGQTFVLTPGLDAMTGTAGNDTFTVYSINPTTGVTGVTNLNAYDTIDGGAGRDTLNIDMTGGANSMATGFNAPISKNVEIVNITGNSAAVDASLFTGATLVNQIGTAGTVNNLAAGEAAGFQSITAGPLNVNAAGSSAAVSLNGVTDTVVLNVAANGTAALGSVTVSGTRTHSGSGSTAALALNVTAGKSVQTVSVSTDQKTTLTVAENSATTTKHITTVDASASTGAVTFDASTMAVTTGSNIATIKSGSGNDTITISATTAAADATAGTAAINATVSTGAGNDTINVKTTGTGLTTVDAGAGNDTINITKVTGAGLNVTGGDGNDTVILVSGHLETTDIVDGGAGSNTISLAAGGTAVADDYIVFNKLLKNFSTLAFTGTTAEVVDASQLAANYTAINMNVGGIVTGVGSQALTANGSLTAQTTGYGLSSSAPYAGTLNITQLVDGGTITAKADVLNLSVNADVATPVSTIVTGDIQTANITLTNSVDSTTSPSADVYANVSITTSSTAGALKGLKAVTLTGNGSASITNGAGSKLVSVDASALGGTSVAAAGGATTGLTYNSSNASAETVKLGSGIDTVTIGASTYGAMDTVVGLNLKLTSAGALAAGDDVLHVTGVLNTVVKFTTTQTDLDLALKDAAAASTTVTTANHDFVFTMGGDTYVYHDAGTLGAVDSADTVVKLAGITDVKAVILALGGTPA